MSAKKNNEPKKRTLPNAEIEGGGIVVEQRITSNLVIGATVQAIKAQDYSPINGILFFRYYINDWRGDLYMPPKAPTPYVAW